MGWPGGLAVLGSVRVVRGSGPGRFGGLPRLLGVVALGAMVTSSCRLELEVNLEVERDGSGSVEVVVGLDPDGVDRIGGDLGDVLEVTDLMDAGWEVEGPEIEDDGSTRVRFRHGFADPAEAAVAFADIAASDGPFQGFALSRRSSFARTEWGFTGRLDFSAGIEAFGDAGLAAELDGQPLGQSVEEIEAQLGEELSDVIRVRVMVNLPGEVSSNGARVAESGARWEAAFGEAAQDLAAAGEEQRTSSLVAAAIGAVCGALLVLYGLVRLVRWMMARRRRTEGPAHVSQ